MVEFLTGLNNPIFSDNYARDLGRNQFSGAELWHWPYSDPVPIDLAMPDPNLTAVLDAANSSGIKIYLCLLDSWVAMERKNICAGPPKLD
jgi:hypothetical protein